MDLSPFCSRDQTRPYLLQPFSDGEWTYATNGHVCVRVPRRSGVEENEKMKDKAAALFLNEPLVFSSLPRVEIPKNDDDDCSACDGRGFEHDCPDCSCVCEACNGNGHEEPGSGVSVGIGSAIYAAQYILLLQALPAVEIATPHEKNPVRFRFDGGEGVLMPMRGQRAIHIKAKE